MRTRLFISLFGIALLTSAVTLAQADLSCDAKKLKGEIKGELKPDYKYDSSKITRIVYKDKEQLKEVEVPLFIGEKYRFVFNTKSLPKQVEINVYNKKAGMKKRKLLYSSSKEKDTDNIFVWEPEKSRKMYINYKVPPGSAADQRGCVVFLLGYKL